MVTHLEEVTIVYFARWLITHSLSTQTQPKKTNK